MKTLSNFNVIGKVADGTFEAYAEPEHRRAEPNEVVAMGGYQWQLLAVTGNKFQATVIGTADNKVETS